SPRAARGERLSGSCMRVTVLGAGYVGATSAAVLAYLGHDVTCVEREAARLACWRAGADPLGEPGLAELLRSVQIRFVDEPSALWRVVERKRARLSKRCIAASSKGAIFRAPTATRDVCRCSG